MPFFRGLLSILWSDSQKTIRERKLEFKNAGDEQCRRIDLMPRTEMFELIKEITRQDLRFFALYFDWWSRRLTGHRTFGDTFANQIVDTIKAILMCIQSRLEGTTDIDHMI